MMETAPKPKPRGAKLSAVQTKLSDMTAERQRLQRNMERYFLVAQDLICIAGFDGYFKELNPRWEHVLGWTPEEMLDKPYMEFVHPDDRAATGREVERQAAGAAVISFENRYRCRDGAYRWLRWYSAADEESQLIYASARDVTEEKAVEDRILRLNESLEQRVAERTAQLNTAHDRLRKEHALIGAIYRAQTKFMASVKPLEIFKSLLDNLLMLGDSEYGFIDEMHHTPEGYPYLVARAITDISWNDETRKMHGEFLAGHLKFTNLKSLFGEVMVTGKPVIANDPPRDPRRSGTPPGHPELKSFLGLPLYAGQDMVGVAGLANRPGGYTPEIIEYLHPLVTACAQLIAAWRTEQHHRQVEEEIRKINTELEQRVRFRTIELEASIKELESFTQTIAHDLRAPLRAVNGFGHMLLQNHAGQLSAEGQRLLTVVANEGKRLGQLIDNLLDYARLGREPLVISDVNMTALAETICAELTAQNPQRALQFKCAPLPAARGDAAMLRTVLANLLSNAVKFTKDRAPAVIEIGSRREEDQIVYFVRDNGVGFDMDHADKLFGVFHRLHSEEEFEGTSVGLASVQRILNRHGGHAWAEGKANEGATFYFALPHPAPPAHNP